MNIKKINSRPAKKLVSLIIPVFNEEDNIRPLYDAVSSVINSGVKIGSNCLVAANSFIKSDMPDFSVFGGSPAEKISDIRKIKSKQISGMHYPWMKNFSKGMPWKKIGFENWLKKKVND